MGFGAYGAVPSSRWSTCRILTRGSSSTALPNCCLTDGPYSSSSRVVGGQSHVAAFDVQTRQHQLLIDGEVGRYLPPRQGTVGHTIVGRRGSLYAVPFDATRIQLHGTAVPLRTMCLWSAAVPHLPVSSSGMLAYVDGSASRTGLSTLVWVTRKGTIEALAAPPRRYGSVRLSPVGDRVAVQYTEATGNNVAVYDVTRGTFTPLTFEGNNVSPVWAADGSAVAFRSNRPGPAEAIMIAVADGSSPPTVLASEVSGGTAHAWSKDGRTLVGVGLSRATANGGLWFMSLAPVPPGPNEIRSLSTSAFPKADPRLSPDERWLAYASTETDRSEFYVQSFPAMGERIHISISGGTNRAGDATVASCSFEMATR